MSRSLSLQEGVVLFQLLIQGFQADSYVRVKDFGPDFSAGDGPVADDLAVEEDDGPEDAGVVVGAVGVVGVEYVVAAYRPCLVTIPLASVCSTHLLGVSTKLFKPASRSIASNSR